MNQNSTIDNDLQKAIDDITNNTNTDPVFSDPVAAPSSVPEGDTGELDEPVGPFPESQPTPPLPFEAPATPSDQVAAPLNPTTPPISMPTPEPIVPPVTPETLEYNYYNETVSEPAPRYATEPVAEVAHSPRSTSLGGMQQVKEAALRDLIPLLGHLNMNPSQKFNLYRDIFENLRDYTVLDPAYHAATEITDEHERAEALLYLVESIDKM